MIFSEKSYRKLYWSMWWFVGLFEKSEGWVGILLCKEEEGCELDRMNIGDRGGGERKKIRRRLFTKIWGLRVGRGWKCMEKAYYGV